MMLYKLVKSDFTTKNGMVWIKGQTNRANGKGKVKLCTMSCLHAYRSPELAAFMAPLHVGSDYSTLIQVEGKVSCDDGLKVGCRSMKFVDYCVLPVVSTDQRVAFAIRCALAVYSDQSFKDWAASWISGKDRSSLAAHAAADAAARAAYSADAAARAANAAAAAAADAAAYAAEIARAAAYSAANAAANADAAAYSAANAAANADAYAAAAAADAAAYAYAAEVARAAAEVARAAAEAARAAKVDLQSIAKETICLSL